MKNLTKNLMALFTISLFIVMACKTVEDVKPTIAPTLKTGIATDITGNTAKVSGSVSVVGTLSISDYGVVYGTSSSPTLNDSKMSLGSLAAPKDFTTDLSGLSQNTSYNFRVYVTNSGGTVYGDAVAFKTLELKAPTSTTGTSSVITQNGFTMDGKLTDIGTSAVTDFGHCISETNQMPTIADTKTSMGAASGAKDFKSVFANLKAGTTYYVRSFATNGVGTAYGDKVEVKTTMVSAPTVTTGVSSAVAATTATMAGSVKAIGTENITQYGHVWSSTNATPTIADSKTSLGALTTAKDFTSNLTGLTAATTYNVRSYATNSVGTAYGDVVQFKTDVVKTITIDCGNVPEVWEDLGDGVDYIVNCRIGIKTKLITIKPGVKIQFEGSGTFDVFSDGALKMVGTSAKPIILEGKNAVQGYWIGVSIATTSTDNQWEYVTIRNAGKDQDAGLLLDAKSRIVINNCSFTDNKGYGILQLKDVYEQKSIFGFDSNIFTNNTKAALQINRTNWGSLDSKSKYADNGQKYINVVNTTFGKYDDYTVQKLDVPYRFTEDFTIRNRVVLNPGVTMEFGSDVSIDFYDKASALIANGTASEPIKFVGYVAGKGVWGGILYDENNVESKLNYCIIDGAGSKSLSTTNFNYWYEKNGKAAIVIDGTDYKGSYRMTVTNCIISNSGGYGIAYSIYSKDAVTIKDNTYKDNAKANVIEFSY
jgi:hypothetical protein